MLGKLRRVLIALDFGSLSPNGRARQKSRPSGWPGRTQRHNGETRDMILLVRKCY
jgi:hypothetical protein